MASGNLRCPNSACQQKHLVIDTKQFICSACGTQIDAQHAIDAELRRKKRKALIAPFYPYLSLLGLMSILGFIFHEIGRVALVAFPVFATLTIFTLIKRNGKARDFGFLSLAALVFFVFSILGDVMNSPTAVCADGSLSHSSHNQGTCSHHGGVSEWNPPPWWER